MGSVAELDDIKIKLKPEHTNRNPAAYSRPPGCWPGGGGQGDHQGLQQPSDVGEGVLPGEDKVEEREEDESVDEEASEHGDAVPAQLLPQRARVLHVQDLSSHQEDDSEWKVPESTNRRPNDESADISVYKVKLCKLMLAAAVWL